jgi:hypothetical protein
MTIAIGTIRFEFRRQYVMGESGFRLDMVFCGAFPRAAFLEKGTQ